MALPIDGESFMRAIALAYASETKSVVTFVAVTQFDAHGGPFHVHSSSETAYAEAASAPQRKRVLRAIDDGKSAAPDELLKRSNAPEDPLSRFGMRVPFLPATMMDYAFGKPHDEGANIVVEFKSAVRDAAHGDGTIAVLKDSGRLESVVIRPAQLPPRATSMTTTFDFGKVSDDRWDVVKITHAFTGRQGIISGGGASVTTYEHYRPYPTESAAAAAVDAMQATPM